MIQDLLHEPKVLYWFRHIGGDLDIAISTGDNQWRMTLVPDTNEVRKLIKKKDLSADDLERVVLMEKGYRSEDIDHCCSPDCGAESDGTDRGRPLCESCWEAHSTQSEIMAERFYDPPEVEIDDDKDPYSMLFG